MAVFTWDAASKSLGDDSDWTILLNEADNSSQNRIQSLDVVDEVDGRALEVITSSDQFARAVIGLDAAPIDPVLEIFLRAKYKSRALTPETGLPFGDMRPTIYAQDLDTSSINLYTHGYRLLGGEERLAQYINGDVSNLATGSTAISDETVFNTLIQIDMNTGAHRVKSWEQVDSEPTNFMEVSGETDISPGGAIGLFTPQEEFDYYVYYYSVGSAGDSATRPDQTPGEITGTSSDADGNLLGSGTMYAFRADGTTSNVESAAIQSDGTWTFTGLTSGEDYIVTGQSVVDTASILPQGRIMTAS